MDTMIGIYKITSPTGKIYIGQSIDIYKRFRSYKTLDCKRQPGIFNSLKKHGADKHLFEIICECAVEDLNDKERYYQDIYQVTEQNGLNCRLTLSTDKSGYFSEESIKKMCKPRKPLSEDHKRKLSVAHTGKVLSEEHKQKIKDAHKPFKHSEETILMLRRINTGKKMSQESREKMSKASRKRVFSDETRKKLSMLRKGDKHPMFGKNHKESSKQKISAANKGFKHSEAVKTRMSLAKKGKKPNNCRIILDIESGVFYYSSEEVSALYGFGRSTLVNKLNGVRYNNTRFIYV